MASSCIILTTAGSKREAAKIARALVGRRLAACINCLPASSIFRWRGKIEQAPEVLLVIKSTRSAFAKVAAAIAEMHSYELPECIELPITAGTQRYLDWISESVTRRTRRAPRAASNRKMKVKRKT